MFLGTLRKFSIGRNTLPTRSDRARPHSTFSHRRAVISSLIVLVDEDLMLDDSKHDRPPDGEVGLFIDPTNTHLIAPKKRSRPSSMTGFSPLGKRHTNFYSGTLGEAELTPVSTSTTMPASFKKKRPRSASLLSEAPPRRSTRIAAAHSTANSLITPLGVSFAHEITIDSLTVTSQVSTARCGMTFNNTQGDSVNNLSQNEAATASYVTTSTGYAEISPSPSRTSTPGFLSSSSDLDTQSLLVSTASCGMTLINSQGDSVNNLSQTNSAAASDVTTSTGHAEIFQQSLKLMDDSNA